MGIPFAPCSTDVPLHPPPPKIYEWHQQTYGVPFMSTEDEEGEDKKILMTGSSLSCLPTRGIRVHLHSILLPRILLVAILPQLTLGKKTLQQI
jgi:hypothetical protein